MFITTADLYLGQPNGESGSVFLYVNDVNGGSYKGKWSEWIAGAEGSWFCTKGSTANIEEHKKISESISHSELFRIKMLEKSTNELLHKHSKQNGVINVL